MGSPFSLSICHQYFSRTLFAPIESSNVAWVGRYVDNRLTLLSPLLEKMPPVAAFLHLEAYGPPVLLECEDGDVFLGFHVDVP